MQSCRSFILNAPLIDDTGLKKKFSLFLFSPALCFVIQRRKVVYMVDSGINYSRISTFDLFALRWGSWLWCQQWMKTKSPCLPIGYFFWGSQSLNRVSFYFCSCWRCVPGVILRQVTNIIINISIVKIQVCTCPATWELNFTSRVLGKRFEEDLCAFIEFYFLFFLLELGLIC